MNWSLVGLKDLRTMDRTFNTDHDTSDISENEISSETIDLDNLLESELTSSASFDLRFLGQAEFVKLLQTIPVSTLLLDTSGKLVFSNYATGKLTDHYKDLVGSAFSSLFSDAGDVERADSLLANILADRRPRIVEGTFRFFDRRIWGRMHLRVVRVKEELFVIALTENLTDEKKRLILNEKYKKVVNLLPIGIVEFRLPTTFAGDLQGEEIIRTILKARVVDGNNEFARIQGYSDTTQLIGRTLNELFPYLHENRILYAAWLRAGFEISSLETQEEGSGGAARYLENTFIGQIRKGLLRGFWLLKRDVTDRQRIKEEAIRAQKLESLAILAGGIAHDFNNLLTAILGNINLAKMALDTDGSAHKRLQEAERGSWRARELTEQLVTFAKGRILKKTTISMEPLLRESVAFALRGSNVKCEFSLPEDLFAVDVDEGQISQVIYNLIINADQALPDGGNIHVGAENINIRQSDGFPVSDGRYIRVSISDGGEGILQEHLSRIFDPYFTTKKNGTGLGLATSQSIVRSHGGFVTVESDLSSGTTFYVYLPASDQVVSTQIEEPPVEFGGQGRILVMDDEQMIRDVSREMLEHIGYEVQCADHGRRALELYTNAVAEGRPFDVVIIDLTVPGGMGGIETMRELLKIDPDVKAVVSTGYSKDPVLKDFQTHGFKAVVRKPYDVNQLNALLRRVTNVED